jgi:hypothetical protein
MGCWEVLGAGGGKNAGAGGVGMRQKAAVSAAMNSVAESQRMALGVSRIMAG